MPAVPEPLDRHASRSVADGALYVSGGDGASFNFVDYGQDGAPRQPLRRPAGRRRRRAERRRPPRAARCAARTCAPASDPVGLDGTIMRVDPATGAGAARQPARRQPPTRTPAGSSPTACATRSASPSGRAPTSSGSATSAGTTGRRSTASPTRRRGRSRTSAGPATRAPAASLATTAPTSPSARTSTASTGAVDRAVLRLPPQQPRRARTRPARPAAPRSLGSRSSSRPRRTRTRPSTTTRSSSPTTRATASGSMPKGADGLPGTRADPHVRRPAPPTRSTSRSGPGGDLYYVDFDGGTIRRIQLLQRQPAARPPSPRPPPTTGPAPLTVSLRRHRRRPTPIRRHARPTPGTSTATAPSTTRRRRSRRYTYTTRAATPRTLRVTDSRARPDTDAVTDHRRQHRRRRRRSSRPAAGTTWKVGDVIAFSGSATDAQDGTLPASALSWTPDPPALPVQLPRAPDPDLHRGRERLVRRARPRVPVLSGARADRDRLGRPDRHDDAAARPAHGRRSTFQTTPGGLQLAVERSASDGAVQPHGDPRVDELGQRPIATDRRERRATTSSRGRTAARRHMSSSRVMSQPRTPPGTDNHRRRPTSSRPRCGRRWRSCTALARPVQETARASEPTAMATTQRMLHRPFGHHHRPRPQGAVLLPAVEPRRSREPVIGHRELRHEVAGGSVPAGDRTQGANEIVAEISAEASPGGRSRRSLR